MSESMQVLQAVLPITLLWVVWHFGWKKYQLDQLRQKLFCIRDELFISVASNEINVPLDSEANMELRRFFNTAIRYSHLLTLNRGVISMALSKLNIWGGKIVDLKTFKSPSDIAIGKIENEQTRKQLSSYKMRAHFACIWYLYTTSPVFNLLLTVIAIVVSFGALVVGICHLGTMGIGTLLTSVKEKVTIFTNEPIRAMEAEAELYCAPLQLKPA